MTADLLNTSLSLAKKRLYVKVSEAFADYELDTSDPANPVLIIDGYELPTNKDLLITPQGQEINLNGLTVYFETEGYEALFIPAQAVRFMQNGKAGGTPRGKAVGWATWNLRHE